MPLSIAVIAGGGFQGQGIIQAIHAIPDARAVVVDSTRDALGELLADRYVQSPALASGQAFDDFLVDLVASERIDLVLPATQRELRCLAGSVERLRNAGARTAVCPTALLETLLDKRELYRELADAGVAAQRPIALSPAAAFPLYGRPREGWGGRDNLILRAQSDISPDQYEALAQSHVWVPLIDSFDELSADFAIDFDARVSPMTLRRRVRTSGGFAVVSQSLGDGVAEERMRQLTRWLATRGACGLFNVQLLMTADGRCLVSDVNPRHGTSGGHALAEGNNLVAFLLGSGPGHRDPVRTVRLLAQQAVPLFERGGIQGVVFDLDDTLLDHKRWILDRMEVAAAGLADAIAPSDLLLATYAAIEEGEHARLIDVVSERLERNDLHGRLLAAYRAALPRRAHLYPEVPDVLRKLRELGLRLAIITDNPPASQRSKVDASEGLAEAVDLIVFSREQGAEKPAKEGFAAAAAGLGLDPAHLLMVGDNPARDAIGAIRAGYRSCLLVRREDGRYQPHQGLLHRHATDVASRTWIAGDLRVLPLALRLSMAGET